MTHELQQLFNVNSSASGQILDFDFISDENFLLVVALTNKGNIITVHRSNGQQKCELVPLFDVYAEYCEPILIGLLPDASAVVLVLSNDAFLLVPIRCLMNAKWGDQNGINEPVQFQVEINVDACLRLPTSVVSFKSAHNGRTYIAFSNKAGCINIVDVQLRRLIASLSTNETIHRLEVYRPPARQDLWLVITHFTGQQSLLRLESPDLPLREHLAHTVPDEQIIQIDDQLTTINMDNFLTVHSTEKSTLHLVNNIAERAESAQFTTPQGTWLTFYAPRLMLCVVAESDIYSCFPFIENCQFKMILREEMDDDLESDSRVLGFVPITRSNVDELDRCLVVSTAGISFVAPKLHITSLTLNQLSQSSFSKVPFLQICELTHKDPWTLYETILREVVGRKPSNADHIDGLMLLAIEMGFELKKLTTLVNELGEYDALIPYLSIRCDKDQTDPTTRQLLFETYVHKLWKLDPNSKEKERLEQDIRQFLIRFDSSAQVITVLLKHNLLSCVNVQLQRQRSLVTPQVASHLIEVSKWQQFDRINLLRILCGLHWTILESPIKTMLYKKFLAFTGHLRHPHEYAMLLAFLLREQRFDPVMITPLMIYAGSAVQNHLNPHQPKWRPLALGSNCTLVIGDDRSLWTWGEFKAGNQRARNINDELNRPNTRKRTAHDGLRSILVANGQENASLFNLTKVPKELEVPTEVKDEDPMGFCQVACGTEHILLLTSQGRIYTLGVNRFGQCGVGHRQPVVKMTEVTGSFGPIVSIHAGHYTSAFIDLNGSAWICGWGVHGQLGCATIDNIDRPIRVNQLGSLIIKDVALGYSHSLFLTVDGQIYGCGHMDNGELISDPQKLPKICGNKPKTWQCLKLDLPEPVDTIACGYFHGLAVSKTAIYQWGECPQTLKMNAFWQKRQNAKSRSERNSQTAPDSPKPNQQVDEPLDVANGPMLSSWQLPEENIQLSRDHFRFRRITDWDSNQRPIRSISAGYNHSAILTTDGEILTWGRSLDCQLGHGTKADKALPTQIVGPLGVVWANVQCGRNTTAAVSDKGEVYVWGRNDRAQLGVPMPAASSSGTPAGSANASPKRYIFKSSTSNKKRPIEVPVSQCVDKPTLVSGLFCGVHYNAMFQPDLEDNLQVLVNSCDQQILHTTAQELRAHPVYSVLALEVQLMAGDLLHAADTLSIMYAFNRQRIQREICEARGGTTRVGAQLEPNHNTLPAATNLQTDDPSNGNSIQSSTSPKSKGSSASLLDAANSQTNLVKIGLLCLDDFEHMVDRLWSLITAHPLEDAKTLTVLIMLCKQLPIYGRVSMDQRLCRLVAGHVELPQKNALSSSSTATTRKISSPYSSTNDPSLLSNSDYCTSSTLNRQRMNELRTPRERAAALRRARCPGPSKIHIMRQRVEPLTDRLDFFSACGHFERRQQEEKSRKTQLSKQKFGFRKCSQCVPKAGQQMVASATQTP